MTLAELVLVIILAPIALLFGVGLFFMTALLLADLIDTFRGRWMTEDEEFLKQAANLFDAVLAAQQFIDESTKEELSIMTLRKSFELGFRKGRAWHGWLLAFDAWAG